VVNHLVAHRFAEELGVEEEIWFVEYPHTQLAIWRKKDSSPRHENEEEAGESPGH